jgi:hypothetical protein
MISHGWLFLSCILNIFGVKKMKRTTKQTEQTAQYRREGSRLYKLDDDGKAYIFCYANSRLETSSLNSLVKAYHEAEDDESE